MFEGRYRSVVTAVLVATAFVLATADAESFRRTTVEPRAPDEPDDGCWNEGTPLYHPSQCVPYHLLARESPIVPNAILSAALARAFATWTSPKSLCSPGVTAFELSPVDEPIVFYPKGGPGTNVVGVVDGWDDDGMGGTLALTTLVYRGDTGEVLDFGLELDARQRWSFDEMGTKNGIDLESVLVHEVGHALGFAHPTFDGAPPRPLPVMLGSYNPGTIRRALALDDREAICSVYPNLEQRRTGTDLVKSTACELAPRSTSPKCEPRSRDGCAAAKSAGPGDLGLWLAISCGAMAVASRLRARRARLRRGSPKCPAGNGSTCSPDPSRASGA